MKATRQRSAAVLFAALSAGALPAAPVLPGVGAAMRDVVERREIAGAVTMVVTAEQVLHQESTGMADLAARKPMTSEALFWIASMTKPVTGAAILILQDEGKLSVDDPVAKYIPDFAALKTPSGRPANLTITQILSHTSGLGEASGPAALEARTLADLVPLWLAARMQFEPGAQWKYCQSGINLAGRIVEVVSGKPFDVFVRERIFVPLGMKDATFYPDEGQRARIATGYARKKETGGLEPAPARAEFGRPGRPPLGNAGLFCSADDYARFCQMLLGGGVREGKRVLSAKAVKALASAVTGDLPTGFFQNETFGKHGANYGWGIGTCVLKAPHAGAAEMLSPGSYGHGGAWGTQAWIDPAKGVAYILMVQRANFPNSDASDVRVAFQRAAAAAIRR
ncbi:MAG: beta-lactamase family protein [Opitutaceae bacterium]|nr:beta-lactamase family protein [Opitutaceae bacterium]